jgi:type IV fimbrial biogenesis protein FimT
MLRRYSSGFTLIELMVTVMVVIILGMLAAPGFQALIEKGRLRGAADDVVNLLGVSRSEAVKRQQNVSVAISGTSAAWCLGANRAPTATAGQAVIGSSACDCNVDATKCVLDNQNPVVTVPANSGVTSDTVTGSITFDAQTGARYPLVAGAGALTQFTLSSPKGYAVQISVSPLGQVSACIPAGKSFMSGYPSC